jgi:hypothetical protein
MARNNKNVLRPEVLNIDPNTIIQALIPALFVDLDFVDPKSVPERGFDKLVKFNNMDQVDQKNGKDPYAHLRNTVLGQKERWLVEVPSEFKGRIRVLAHTNPEIKGLIANITRLANTDRDTYGPGALQHWQEYVEAVDAITVYLKEDYDQKKDKSCIAVILLQGGLRFKEPFGAEIEVETKRLNLKAKDGTPTQMVALDDIKGTEDLMADHPDGITLVLPDDCFASLASTKAVIALWQEKAARGEAPHIKKIIMYAIVGVQQGMIAMLDALKAMGITDVEIVVGERASAYDEKLYIRNAAPGEDPNNAPYTVGDMGKNLAKPVLAG